MLRFNEILKPKGSAAILMDVNTSEKFFPWISLPDFHKFYFKDELVQKNIQEMEIVIKKFKSIKNKKDKNYKQMMNNKDLRIIIEESINDFLYKKNKSNLNITFNRIAFIFCFFLDINYLHYSLNSSWI